jgi:hypothetical protein
MPAREYRSAGLVHTSSIKALNTSLEAINTAALVTWTDGHLRTLRILACGLYSWNHPLIVNRLSSNRPDGQTTGITSCNTLLENKMSVLFDGDIVIGSSDVRSLSPSAGYNLTRLPQRLGQPD